MGGQGGAYASWHDAPMGKMLSKMLVVDSTTNSTFYPVVINRTLLDL